MDRVVSVYLLTRMPGLGDHGSGDLVFPEYFRSNSDAQIPEYETKYGI